LSSPWPTLLSPLATRDQSKRGSSKARNQGKRATEGKCLGKEIHSVVKSVMGKEWSSKGIRI